MEFRITPFSTETAAEECLGPLRRQRHRIELRDVRIEREDPPPRFHDAVVGYGPVPEPLPPTWRLRFRSDVKHLDLVRAAVAQACTPGLQLSFCQEDGEQLVRDCFGRVVPGP